LSCSKTPNSIGSLTLAKGRASSVFRSMSYEIAFVEEALTEWGRLDQRA